MVPQYMTLAPMPAQNSMATQLAMPNSGLASGPPKRTLPNLPIASHARMKNVPMANHR